MKVTLTIIGVGLEVVGLMLTASPELAPRARRFGAGLTARVRRLLGRPRHLVMEASPGTFTLSGRASAFVSVSNEAPLERKLRFLIDQAVETQQKLDQVESRLQELPAEWRKEIGDTRTALEERIAQELHDAREQFIGERLTGLALIVTGSVLLGLVNLLP
jgi:hypothetical protein